MRDALLAPHLSRFEVWQDLADSLDDVWAAMGLDDRIEQLKWLRSPVNTTGVTVDTGGKMFSLSTIPQQDRETAIKSADLLGFRYYDSNLVSSADYIKLCRHLAEYYAKDKGTESWTDFLGFCLNTNFSTQNLWTQDYKEFLPEGDPGIGVSVEFGGPWYPTTHIIVEYDQERFAGIKPSQMVEFFYYFANINLVIYLTQIGSTETIKMVSACVGSPEIFYPAVAEPVAD